MKGESYLEEQWKQILETVQVPPKQNWWQKEVSGHFKNEYDKDARPDCRNKKMYN